MLDQVDGMSDEMKGWMFSNTARYPNIAPAYDAALAAAVANQWFLTFSGSYGVGKTRLISCILNEAKARNRVAIYSTTAVFLDHLRSAFSPDAEVSYDETWERFATADVLALDELDRWNTKEWAREKFDQLIDERYRHGASRLTVFATNKSIEEVPGYLRSRMRDRRCGIYVIKSPDARRLRD